MRERDRGWLAERDIQRERKRESESERDKAYYLVALLEALCARAHIKCR